MSELNWIPVQSSRISSAAYDSEAETIYVRFHEGGAWWYGGCPQHVWEEFMAEATSKGRYIKDVLDGHQKGPVVV